MSRRKGWRQCGCYVWRTRKPHAFLGLPLIGRHFAYCGETSSRYHRDRQHRYGGGTYGHTAKMWADLDPKVYPLPCLFPRWAPARKAQEWLYIKLLLPVYNVQHNGTNPRRVTARQLERQRWARDRSGVRVNVGRAFARGALGLGLLVLAAWVLLQNIGQ